MFTGQIYIQETANSDVAFINSYLKDVLGVAKLYVYIPLIGNSVSDYTLMDNLLASGRIPKSAYDQALVNMPIGASGEFETTESVNLPSASDVYDEIIKIPQLAGLVSPTDTLAQLVTAIDASGYLVTFNNIDMFINNQPSEPNIVQINSDYTPTEDVDLIIADANANSIVVLFPLSPKKGNIWTVKRSDKSDFILSVKTTSPNTIDGLFTQYEISKTDSTQLDSSLTFIFDGTDFKIV